MITQQYYHDLFEQLVAGLSRALDITHMTQYTGLLRVPSHPLGEGYAIREHGEPTKIIIINCEELFTGIPQENGKINLPLIYS